MQIGILGLPNKGKSTLFNAMTSAQAKMANYPFTTISPNQGVAFASKECPHVRLKLARCDPNNAPCHNGIRKIPVNVMDVAGLVEGAHDGKGMGNQFLSDIAAADCLIVVADVSGGSDDEGNPASEGSHDPVRDVQIALDELHQWMADILKRNAVKCKGRKFEDFAATMTGLKISIEQLHAAYLKLDLPQEGFGAQTKEEFLELAIELRKSSKPVVVAANKSDSPHAKANIAKLAEAFPELKVIPTAAAFELVLKSASGHGFIRYDGRNWTAGEKSMEPAQSAALEKIRNALAPYGGTGIQELVDHCAFGLLNQIVLYPVEDEVHYSNNFGKVLPDAVLLPNGATPPALAAKIHTDLAKGFLYAVDAEKKMRIGKDAVLHDGQIVKIVSAK